MELNLLILGCMFILTLFTVGEKIYSHFKINRYLALFLILILIGSLFLSPIIIGTVELSYFSFILPSIICFFLLFKIRKFSRFFLALMFCIFLSILYQLTNMEDISTKIIQPFILFGAFIGILTGIVCANFPSCIIALFGGINLGSLLYNLTRYESLESMFLNENLSSAILIGILCSMIIVFLKQKFALYRQGQELEKYM